MPLIEPFRLRRSENHERGRGGNAASASIRIRWGSLGKRAISIHEAAHAVMVYRLGGRMRPEQKAWANEQEGRVDYLSMSPKDDSIVGLAGVYAEKLFLGKASVDHSANQDVKDVMENAKRFELPMEEVKKWSRECISLLNEPATKNAVLTLASEIERKGALNGEEVETILAPAISEWQITNDLRKKRFRIVRNKAPQEGRISAPVDSSFPGKSFEAIEKDGAIVDYQNVVIKGYLSTFGNVDRDGDTVERGAFKESIPRFMRNPVLLCDHLSRVGSLVGRFTRMFEDDNGLFVEAELSNGQSDYLRHVRALVAEGHLRTLSMGGIFHYNGSSIVKVELLEGTLTPIPANPQAIFERAK